MLYLLVTLKAPRPWCLFLLRSINVYALAALRFDALNVNFLAPEKNKGNHTHTIVLGKHGATISGGFVGKCGRNCDRNMIWKPDYPPEYEGRLLFED